MTKKLVNPGRGEGWMDVNEIAILPRVNDHIVNELLLCVTG